MAIKNIVVYSKKLPPDYVGGVETNAYYLVQKLVDLGIYNILVVTIQGKLSFLERVKAKRGVSSGDFSGRVFDLVRLKKTGAKRLDLLMNCFSRTGFLPAETVIYHNSLDLHGHFSVLKNFGYLQIGRSGGNDLFFHQKSSPGTNEFLSNLNYLDRLILNSNYSKCRSEAIDIDSSLLRVIKGGAESPCNLLPPPSSVTLPRGVPIILSCGRLVDFKGIGDALSALALLRNKGVKFFYSVVGDGELRENLERQTAELRLNDCVKFFGKVTPNDVQHFYKNSSLYLSSSKDVTRSSPGYRYVHTETMGRSICEAQINGVPVISTDAGGSPEMLVHEKTGIVVPQGDIRSMSEALETLLCCESVRRDYAQAAKRHALDHFSWESVVDNTVNIVRELS